MQSRRVTTAIRRTLIRNVKNILNSLGVDVRRTKNVPRLNLAGLSSRDVRTVIDCGANEGQFVKEVLRFYPKAKIYCFEPLATPFKRLSDWASRSEADITCIQSAIGDIAGEASMYYHVEHSPSSSFLRTSDKLAEFLPETAHQAEVRVPVTTLDDALGPSIDSFENEVLLKMDVQGFEDRVLRGAVQLLKRVDACMLEVSLDRIYFDQATFRDLVDALDDFGFGYAGNIDQFYGADGHVMWLDALFCRRAT